MAALALLPAAMFAATAAPAPAEEAPRQAKIEAGKRTVPFGQRVTLRGQFPGVADAKVEIRHRAAGSRNVRLVTQTRTGDAGYYRIRVRPRRSGYWTAQLASAERALMGSGETDGDGTAEPRRVERRTDPEAVRVRSRTRARLATRHTRVGRSVRVSGRVRPGDAGRRVIVRAAGRRKATRTRANGRFSTRVRAGSTGRFRVRVIARGNAAAKRSRDSAGKLTVYRPASASWYGPGFYGNRTACGQTLTSSTEGVAHRSMPCGTKLRLRYGGRTVSARVIDRGPYVAGREFDLTYATKRKLGFPDTGTVLSSK